MIDLYHYPLWENRSFFEIKLGFIEKEGNLTIEKPEFQHGNGICGPFISLFVLTSNFNIWNIYLVYQLLKIHISRQRFISKNKNLCTAESFV